MKTTKYFYPAAGIVLKCSAVIDGGIMISKIVWASYGNQDPAESVEYVKMLASKYRSEVVGVYVKPTAYFEGIEYLPAEESSMFRNWVEKSSEEITEQIQDHSETLKEQGLNFRLVIRDGIPHREIMQVAVDEAADLIAIGKGKTAENDFSVARTVLKLIRQSDIPVLSADRSGKDIMIQNIVVPTGLYNIHSRDFELALSISNDFNSRIYHLNVMTTSNLNLPAEVVNRLRGDTYTKIAELDLNFRNVEPRVVESVNPAKGISDFINDNDIDLVVMLTYSGRKKRGEEFIGSVAQKLLQEVNCPVITMRP